jgi:type III pantothenate kinase
VAVGIGNTTVKVGVAEPAVGTASPNWAAQVEIPTSEFQPAELSRVLPPERLRWRVASVQRAAEARLADWVRQFRSDDDYWLLCHRDLPLIVDVEAPDRVGMDRLAASVAANRLRDSGRPAVVVDAGTAITVNLVAADGVFRGGAILPGFKLTAKALSEGTDLLPLVAPEPVSEPPLPVGRSTQAAIRSGLFWGSVGAVRELVNRISAELGVAPQVFVTGGDARRLTEYLGQDARFVPDLVLLGIAGWPGKRSSTRA